MPLVMDLTGQVFSDLTVVARDESKKFPRIKWFCQCRCGAQTSVFACALRSGNTKSCGCGMKKSHFLLGKYNEAKALDLTGEIFGDLIALFRDRSQEFDKPRWVCKCKCGKQTSIRCASLRAGDTKSCGCQMVKARDKRNRLQGPEHAGWRGGMKCYDSHGYIIIYRPKHPNCWSNGCVREHVKVMSEVLGRPLVKGENVHHKNGVRDDNRPENLELWSTSQPSGQRIDDKIQHAKEILRQYAPELLAEDQ